MKKVVTILLLSMIIMLLVSCTLILSETPVPTSTFDILSGQHWVMEGVVLNIRPYDKIVIEFAEIRDKPLEFAVLILGDISFTDDCLVWKVEDESVKAAVLSDLAVGQRIRFNSEYIIESVPFQAQAYEVLILSPGAVESQTPISTFLPPQFTGTITSIEDSDDEYISKLIHLDIISSPLHPDVKEAIFALRAHSLFWQQTETGYQLIKEDDLAVGQVVSVLIQRYYDEISDRYPHQGSIEELIILQ